MFNIVICGSGAFARELCCWIRDSESTQEIRFKGFLDARTDSLDKHKLGEFHLGDEDSYHPDENDRFLIGIADCKLRQIIYSRLNSKGFKFINYIHDSVLVGGAVKFGEGNIICPNSVLTTDISIGDANIFNIQTTVGHDVVIGSFNTFSSNVDVTGYSLIGNANFFGSRVSILPKCRIGSNNKIAAGSVVYKGIRDNAIFLGNPAKKVGSNV